MDDYEATLTAVFADGWTVRVMGRGVVPGAALARAAERLEAESDGRKPVLIRRLERDPGGRPSRPPTVEVHEEGCEVRIPAQGPPARRVL